jgi:hypothetical protein
MEARRRAAGVVLAVLALGAAYGVWRAYFRAEETIVRDRLEALVAELNEGTADGLGLVARAAKIGSFFTEDVVVDLGEGSEPIRGRETVIGMAARLEPRTAALTVAIHDVNVTIAEGGTADVDLTATFTRREESAREPSIDAREFELGMRKVNGEWLIARVTAVEPLNK